MIAALVVVGWIAFGVWALSVVHSGSKGPHFRDAQDTDEMRAFYNRVEASRARRRATNAERSQDSVRQIGGRS